MNTPTHHTSTLQHMKYTYFALFLVAVLFVQCSFQGDAISPSNTGTSGSLAAMTIVGNILYTLDHQTLRAYSISDPKEPKETQVEIKLDPGVETIFAYKNKLFLGSQTGMYIYDINNPINPVELAQHSHFFGCDPVVANDSIAFVTVRSAETCRGVVPVNQLEIVDVTEPAQPYTIEFIDLNNPSGLGLDDAHLFVTDGDAGIQVFDVSTPDDGVELIGNIPVNVFDVIPLDGLLIAVGIENLYQFDYTNINDIRQLSALQLSP